MDQFSLLFLFALAILVTKSHSSFADPPTTRCSSSNMKKKKAMMIIKNPAGVTTTGIISSTVNPNSEGSTTLPIYHHHTAIRTRNIDNAIKFYSLFGYQVETKFRAGPARAAWLVNHHDGTFTDDHKRSANTNSTMKGTTRSTGTEQSKQAASRLEVIEVPSYILQEREGTIKRALDLIENEAILGMNHYALDVTSYIRSLNRDEYYGLDQFLNDINEDSMNKFGKTLRIAKKSYQKAIGNQVFELCFLYDADGCIMELLRYIKDLDQNIQSGWEPWDGTGFVGVKQ